MDRITLVRGAKPKVKDLTPQSPAKVKGGGIWQNDNLTLLRAAKPKVKDLTPQSPDKVKGGLMGATRIR